MSRVMPRTPPAPRLFLVERLWSRIAWMVCRFVWGCRVELTLTVLAVAFVLALRGPVGDVAAVLVAGLVIAAAVALGPARRYLARMLHGSRLRRRWDRACRHARLVTINDRIPRITGQRGVPVGDELAVRVPHGLTVSDVEEEAETLAAILRLREVRVIRDPADGSRATVRLVIRDVLSESGPLPWPNLDAARLSLWEPIPVGLDEDAHPVVMSLVERNLLVGGEPGSGKSVSASMVLATAALDPDVDLYLVDGKRVELALWRPVANGFVGPSMDDAIDLLKRLQEEMDRRYDWMEAHARRKVERGDGLRLVLVAVDELAFYTAGGDKSSREKFNTLLRDLVQRGRAAGIIVLAATQRPSGDIVPTNIRDLFGFRWALRCSTRAASDTILGMGAATGRDADASLIPGFARGVGWLIAEEADPVRLKSFFLDDADVERLARRAADLRARADVDRRDGEEGDPPALSVA